MRSKRSTECARRNTVPLAVWREGLRREPASEPEGQKMAMTNALGVFVIVLMCVFAYALYTAITVAFF